MFPTERRELIVERVIRDGAASLQELREITGVSLVTVRRDLAELQADGRLTRRRGGAIAPGYGMIEPSYQDKAAVAADEKRAIGYAAAASVASGDTILLGAGSSTEAMARALAVNQAIRSLTVMTNSLLVAAALARAPHINVVISGGRLRGATFAMVGPAAEQALASVRATHAFISGNGLTPERGLSTPDATVAATDRAIVAAAREVMVLADHTKIGLDALVQTVPVCRMTALYTDAGVPSDICHSLELAGVTVNMSAA